MMRPEPEREPLPQLDALPRATTIKGWQAGRYIEPSPVDGCPEVDT